MRLKSHSEIKRAFANAVEPTEPNLHYMIGTGDLERKGLREIVVPMKPSVVEKLRDGHRFPGEVPNMDSRFLLADVLLFCPVPLPVWQERAKDLLQAHVDYWRTELSRISRELSGCPAYTLPFIRLLATKESAADWVSDVEQVPVNPNDFLDEVQGILPISQNVWYFRRPFIIWPTESPDSLTHVSYTPEQPGAPKRKITLARLPLPDRGLDRPSVLESPVMLNVPWWRRWLKSLRESWRRPTR